MRRTDDVFFFTLIDFLVQIFFFGLLLFAVSKSIEKSENVKHGIESQKIEDMFKATGVSNLTELLDYLTRLAPLKDLQGTSDFINRAGGQEKAKALIDIVAQAGGVDQIRDKLRRYDEAYGQPPCLKDEIRGKVVPHPLASLRVEDEHIEFLGTTPELEKVLHELGTEYSKVQRLPLENFKEAFQKIKTQYPGCMHFVEVQVATQFLKPMRAIWANFRIK